MRLWDGASSHWEIAERQRGSPSVAERTREVADEFPEEPFKGEKPPTLRELLKSRGVI